MWFLPITKKPGKLREFVRVTVTPERSIIVNREDLYQSRGYRETMDAVGKMDALHRARAKQG